MVVLTCPNCGATMEIEENRQFAFCQYCGTKIANLKNTVEVDRGSEINSLLLRAYEFETKGEFARAREYCDRILDLDPYNQSARLLENRLPSSTPISNVTVVYESVLDSRFKLRVSRDGRNWIVLDPNGQAAFDLPLGTHRIILSGKKNYIQSIKVTDPRQQIMITYKAGKMKNDILVSYR